MYDSCMATKTISIEIDVYERLRSLRKAPSESFSQVLRRELSRTGSITAGELLKRALSEEELRFTEDEIQAIEDAKLAQGAPQDPWSR